MKIAYQHLINYIASKPGIDEVSDKLFQLGHEHEINNGIFDLELTPNRGDCLSLNGILRDLMVFYEIHLNDDLYEKELKDFHIDFVNKSQKACSQISFMKIDIKEEISEYKGLLNKYFVDLGNKKNNFFTDVSNYISYETGQPTHCYDANKIEGKISLEFIEKDYVFRTLLKKEIVLKGKNLVFTQDGKIINLAGIVGGDETSCSNETRSVIVECAHFNPHDILGKSIKYDIQSEAAYKFERGTDPLCHLKVLRRFLKVVQDHAEIKNVEIYSEASERHVPKEIFLDLNRVNAILGTSIDHKTFKKYLTKLGFKVELKKILVPSYRNDVNTINDIAEEIARIIGYDNIEMQSLKLPAVRSYSDTKILEYNLKELLYKHGFYEVINSPFINSGEDNSIKVDNPLDSNRAFIRTDLKESLLENLLYNERRQKDSIKIFEISDVYHSNNKINSSKVLGIICSGRVGNNYLDFSKIIDINYLKNVLNELFLEEDIIPSLIDRNTLDTKLNTKIVYLEIELDKLEKSKLKNQKIPKAKKFNTIKYNPISEFPSSTRDLSFSIKDSVKSNELQAALLNHKSDLIKEIFIFDFFYNQKLNEIKLGFRFIFQSKNSTITEIQVNNEMRDIINSALSIDSVSIPGL